MEQNLSNEEIGKLNLSNEQIGKLNLSNRDRTHSVIKSRSPNQKSLIKQTSFKINIINLPHDDIIIKYILPLLSIDDLFSLKLVSNFFNQLIDYYFKKLKKLNLSNCKWLSNQQINLIFNLNHNLITQLDLSYNVSLNSQFLATCLIVYRFDNLNTIKLNMCHWLDERFFNIFILTIGNQLIHIECSGCWSLNDECVELLSIYCSNLRVLNLSRIYQLTDLSLLNLSYNCVKLVSLDLRYCWKLSRMMIYFLIKQCNQLTNLLI